MHRGRQILAAGLLLAATCVAPSYAQITAPTAEQLELLRGLSDEDRQEILRQLGIEGADSTLRGTARGPLRTDEERREVERLRMLERRALFGDEEEDERTLRPDDTIIIQIGFPPPPTQVQPGQAPTAAPSAFSRQGTQVQPRRRFDADEPPLTPEERARLTELINQVRAKNPYKLDRNGVLYLPGFGAGGIPLAGLDEEEASLRLQTEPAFARLEVEVVRLPVKKKWAAGAEGVRLRSLPRGCAVGLRVDP